MDEDTRNHVASLILHLTLRELFEFKFMQVQLQQVCDVFASDISFFSRTHHGQIICTMLRRGG